MSTFVLYRDAQNRVIPDSELPPKAVPIRTIEARDWIAARDKVSDIEFERVPGHGWF